MLGGLGAIAVVFWFLVLSDDVSWKGTWVCLLCGVCAIVLSTSVDFSTQPDVDIKERSVLSVGETHNLERDALSDTKMCENGRVIIRHPLFMSCQTVKITDISL